MSASIGDAVYCPICVIWITLNPHVIELNLTWILGTQGKLIPQK